MANTVSFHSYAIPRVVKFTETESETVVAGATGLGGSRELESMEFHLGG